MNATNVGKILAVVITVISVAFLGGAIAVTFGGPNWLEALQGEQFNGYKISKTSGESWNWVATRGSDESQFASSKVLPAVVTKVMDEVYQQQQQEISDLRAREPLLNEKAAALRASTAADEVALKAYDDLQRKRLADTRKQSADATTNVIAATAEAQKLENQVSARREDVFRLQQQVEELRADQYRLSQLRQQLEDLLTQVEGDLMRAQKRSRELDRQIH